MLKQLMSEMDEIKEREAAVKQEKADCQARINAIIDEKIAAARLAQGKDLGTVSIFVDGIDVKHTIQKKVTWNQEILFGIYEKIRTSKDNPADYMGVKFTVPEKLYKGFEPGVREIFAAARTVGTGAAKTELKVRGEA